LKARVAVVGGTGQLGSDLVKVLRAGGDEAISLSHADIECADLESVRAALGGLRPEIVINCAAFVRVDECERRPEDAFQVNAIGSLHVAKICAEIDAVCVYISTDYVFDGQKGEPYTEEDRPNPLSVYGTSKLAGEYSVRAACPRHFIVRTSGLYGAAGSSGKGGNFVETMIRLAAEGTPIRVVSDQVLTPTYAKDLAQKIRELLQTKAYGVFHIANNGGCSWYEFADTIFRLLGLRPDLGPTTTEEFGSVARRPAYSVLAHVGLRQVRLENLRIWSEALPAYLMEKGYLKSQQGPKGLRADC